MKMHTYHLYYLSDCDSDNWKKCQSKDKVLIGDVLQLSCGYYHVVCDITQQKTGIRVELSKSCQSPDEAWLVAKQLGHYPKNENSTSERQYPKIHEGDALIEL